MGEGGRRRDEGKELAEGVKSSLRHQWIHPLIYSPLSPRLHASSAKTILAYKSEYDVVPARYILMACAPADVMIPDQTLHQTLHLEVFPNQTYPCTSPVFFSGG